MFRVLYNGTGEKIKGAGFEPETPTYVPEGPVAPLDSAKSAYMLPHMRMKTAKIFRTGKSQAVRTPKEFELPGDEVEIQKRGRSPVLRPKRPSWSVLFDSLDKFTDDFMKGGRKQ